MTDINVIQETAQFVSQPGTADGDNIFHPSKNLILYAYLGRGKTTACKRLLKNYDSYLFLSPRQTFAKFIAGEFNIPCYLDGNYDTKKLVVSVESLLKFNSNIKYQCIVLDECESIVNQFSSHTCNGQHIEIYNKLLEYMHNADKVIFADAFITNRTLDFCRSLPNATTMIMNNTPPVEREAEEIHVNTFTRHLADSIAREEKNYCCFSSYTKLKDTIAELDIVLGDNATLSNALVYHAKVSDSVFDSLNNINASWKAASMVITSPTNTIGCSYSPEGEPDFNAVYVNAMPTCCVRDTFQTQMRVRHLKKNKMIFCLPMQKSLNFFKSKNELQFDVLAEFEDFNADKKEAMMFLIDSVIKKRKEANPADECADLLNIKAAYECGHTPDALKKILYFNLFEKTISSKFYKEMFYLFLARCGYKQNAYQEQKIKEQEIEGQITDANTTYSLLRCLTEQEQEQIKQKISGKKATDIEKLEYEKYWFNKFVKPTQEQLDENMDLYSKAFEENYLPSHKKEIFMNVLTENKANVEKQLIADFNNSGGSIELNEMRGAKLNYIIFILEINE